MDDLPDGTKYEWVENNSDTFTPEESKNYDLKVAYPDNSSETVQVYVNVENED